MAAAINERDLQAAIPDQGGTVGLPGLERPVTVLRDALGIPHIHAASAHDAFFAQGFVHAQDRLWQMEYDRRRAYGRWAAYAGPVAVEHDLLMRRLRLGASARADYEAMDAETRAMFDAYTAGINAFIATTPVLPVEFRLVESAPEPWEPWHCCAVYKVRHVLMGVWGLKLWRMRLLQAGGPALVLQLRAGVAVPGPLIVPPGVEYAAIPDGAEDLLLAAEAAAGVWEWGAGSNSWVVSGSRTASGKPLLAGDSHRALDTPSVYYQNHLTCPDFDVIGFSFGGVPAFPHFGHNPHVAWCITHASADYQDLYIERFDPDDPTRYEYEGQWLDAERYRETVEVRGAAPIAIDVTVTRHGPIAIGDPADGYAVAFRYSATARPNAGFAAFLPMLRAASVAELDAAMRPWVDPCNNLLMADRDGTIGYLTRGEIPLRSPENAWLPVPGWTGAHDWQGSIPFDALPRMRDPESGFFATANNRITSAEYPYFISLDFAPPFRAQRLTDRLLPLTDATLAAMTAIHADKVSIPAQAFLALLDVIEPRDARSVEAKKHLSGWDGTMGPESVAATLYAVWREQTVATIMDGPALRAVTRSRDPRDPMQALPIAARVRASLLALMVAGDTSLLPEGEDWPMLLAESLARAVAWLEAELGPAMAEWRWERLHRTRPQHTLAATFPDLAPLLDPPSVGVGGDGDTPQCGSYGGFEGTGFTITGLSVNRYCFDLADWDTSGWIVPLGSSGHPGSPHYADQLPLWSEQRLAPMHYSPEAVERAAKTRQRLEPA